MNSYYFVLGRAVGGGVNMVGNATKEYFHYKDRYKDRQIDRNKHILIKSLINVKKI